VRIDSDSAAPAAPPATWAEPDPRLLAAAKQFEQQLLSILTRELQQTAGSLGGDDEGSGPTQSTQAGLLSDTLAQAVTDVGGIGLAAELTRSIGGPR